jgi:hypothetical protein
MTDPRRIHRSSYRAATVLLASALAAVSVSLADAEAAQKPSLRLKVVPATVVRGSFTTTATGYSGGYNTVALYFAFPPSTKCQKTEAAMARFVRATLGLKKTVKKNHSFSYQVKEPLGETTGNSITGNYIACAWLYNAAKPGGTQLRATKPYKVIQRPMRG